MMSLKLKTWPEIQGRHQREMKKVVKLVKGKSIDVFFLTFIMSLPNNCFELNSFYTEKLFKKLDSICVANTNNILL